MSGVERVKKGAAWGQDLFIHARLKSFYGLPFYSNALPQFLEYRSGIIIVMDTPVPTCASLGRNLPSALIITRISRHTVRR